MKYFREVSPQNLVHRLAVDHAKNTKKVFGVLSAARFIRKHLGDDSIDVALRVLAGSD